MRTPEYYRRRALVRMVCWCALVVGIALLVDVALLILGGTHA